MTPPDWFFRRLDRQHRAVLERYAQAGGTVKGWQCVFDVDVEGWEGLVRVEYVGTSAEGKRMKDSFEVDHTPRPVRAPRPVRPVRRAKAPLVVECRMRRGIEVPDRPELQKALRALCERCTYRNPAHVRAERMGLYTGNLPRHLKNYEETDEAIIFPRGVLPDIRAVLLRHGFEVHLHDDRIIPRTRVRFAPTARADRIRLRPEQAAIVNTCMLAEQGIVRSPTGSGKTEMAIALVQSIGLRTLVVVWSASLQKQWVQRFSTRLGWDPKQIGLIGGGKTRLQPVTIAMQQSLLKRPDLLEEFDVLIVDEVQRFAARTFREVVGQSPARYRLGFSADETRKDRLESLIYDHFGGVIAEIDKQSLIDRGDICDVDIEVMPTSFRVTEVDLAGPDDRGTVVGAMYSEIISRIVDDEVRNRMVAARAARAVKEGHSVLIFTDRVDHANELARIISSDHRIPCGTALGGVKQTETRERTIANLTSGKLRVAVGTSCIYQGTDIPRLTVGIVATPTGNNRQLLEQQVGRVRRNFPGKTKGTLVYIWDEFVFTSHLKNLRRWYGEHRVRIEGETE